jgi:hypothetical protein
VGGRYDLDAIAEWRAAHIRPRPGDSDPKKKAKKFDHWHMRNERAKALAGEEALRVRRGELVECDWVSRLLARHVSTHNALLEALEDKVLGLLPAKLAATDRRRVKDGVAKVLADLRHQMAECVEEWNEELSDRQSDQEREEEADPSTGSAG